MPKLERHDLKSCIMLLLTFFVLFSIGLAFLLVPSTAIVGKVFGLIGPNCTYKMLYLSNFKTGMLFGNIGWAIFIFCLYIKGLFKLYKYNKDVSVYREQKDLKDFIHECKRKA